MKADPDTVITLCRPPLLVRSTAVTAMSNSVIESVELFHVVLPPRREHKWTGATEPIGGYLLVELVAPEGSCRWGGGTALKGWAGGHGRPSRTNRLFWPQGHPCDPP